MGGKDSGSSISLGEKHEGMEIIPSKNFGKVASFYAKDFANYVDAIINGEEKVDDEKIFFIKQNDLLITIFQKLYPMLPDLLGVTKKSGTCKTLKDKYSLDQTIMYNIIKNIINDILILSIGLKAEGIDENFENLLSEVEKNNNGTKMTFDDLIDFITIIDTSILQSIKNHIDGYKYKDGNDEKVNDLIDIMSLERKRLIEHYLFKYNIDNNIKIKIVKNLMKEENLDLSKDNIDRYIKYIIGYRAIELKNII